MPDQDPRKRGATRPEKVPDDRMAKQFAISLRRAFRTDLDAPLPDHIRRLVEALQKGLKDAERRQRP